MIAADHRILPVDSAYLLELWAVTSPRWVDTKGVWVGV